VQLALAAADDVMVHANDPSEVTIISLAPCQTGSADLFRWVNAVTSGVANGNLGELRMNPTQTLHAVDNLAMSALAIDYKNHADCLGLGGAPGQAWCALEAVLERFEDGAEEILVMAGDQEGEALDRRIGAALLFAKRPLGDRQVVLVRIDRRNRAAVEVVPHAA